MGPGAEIAKRFRLERKLGAGGMGSVWAATHLLTHKSVALKFLHEKHDDAGSRRRMLREARAACAVQHPNVVAVHDVLEGDDGTPILVMDLLRGESLADKLARERTLSPPDAVAVVRPVLSALSAAHAAGIVHRDLKPDNVFLVDGECSNVRILDFGVAKLSGKEGPTKETNRLTETGAMIGTPHYMAPEQAFGESDIDARADLWAVGAVLYECLAGVPPTDGQNLGQILKVLASGKIQPLAARAPAVPRELAAIVDDLLVIEKEARPASAAIVLERLAAIDVDAPTSRSEEEAHTDGVRSDAVAKDPDTMDTAARTIDAEAAPVGPTKARARVWIAGIAAAVGLATAAGFSGVALRTSSAHVSASQASAPRASALDVAPVEVPIAAPPSASGSVVAPAPAPSPIASEATTPSAKSAKSPVLKPTPRRSPSVPAPSAAAVKSNGSPLIVEPTF